MKLDCQRIIKPVNQVVRTLCLLIIGSFLGLATVEVAFRLVFNVEDRNFANTQQWHKQFVRKNSLGYRDREYSLEKPDGIFRILALGDSQTFGHGIKNLEDTWPKQLEILLNEGSEQPRFEVLNISGEGWSSDTQLYELFKTGFRLQPDLILLGYYHNDVPVPSNFYCEFLDRNILSEYRLIAPIVNHSKLYDFLKFRFNRLLERVGKKPTYPECINRLYESRGWDMETIYLHTMHLSTKVQNFHFLMAVIPVLYHLNFDYPLKKAHEILAARCREQELYCIDLFEEAFKGLNAKNLIVAPRDRHLNEKAASIVAQTLYRKLRPLKSYKRLDKFHGAFDLNELLDDKRMAQAVDDRFEELMTGGEHVTVTKDRKILSVTKREKEVVFEMRNNDLGNDKEKIFFKTVLDLNGNFLRSENRVDYDRGSKQFFDLIQFERRGENFVRHAIIQGNEESFSAGKIIPKANLFNFQLKKEGKDLNVQIENGLQFVDPKVFEKKIFDPGYSPSKYLLLEDTKDLLRNFIKSNPTMENDQDLSRLTEDELKESLDEKFIFQNFMILSRYGGKPYIDKLAEEFSKRKPSRFVLRAMAKYYFFNKQHEKLKQFLQRHPGIASQNDFSLN